jgi:hypothetical protein
MAPTINLIDPRYFAEHGHPWDQHEWLRAKLPESNACPSRTDFVR